MSYKMLDIEKLEVASEILKAIAHPMRIAILNLLEQSGSLAVGDLHNLLGIEQAATSHHLRLLKDKGILANKKEGQNSFYFIRQKKVLEIVECVRKCAEEQM